MILSSLIAVSGCSDNPEAPQPAQPGDRSAGKAIRHAKKSGTQVIEILEENAARQLAARFLNDQLKEQQFLAPGGEIDFSPIGPEIWPLNCQARRLGQVADRTITLTAPPPDAGGRGSNPAG